MNDEKTLAYINMFAVLGTLENLCDIVPEAKDIIKDEKISICFSVKNGPCATLIFKDGKCQMLEGEHKCQIKLPFGSCKKFNGLIDGTVTPIPSKGFTHIGFLLKKFVALTDILTKYLRADEQDLKDPEFFKKSTALMFYTISSAISQIANHDEIGKFSAHLIPDGDIMMAIKDGPASTLVVKSHNLTTIKQPSENPRSIMEFGSIKIARDLFDNKVNAIACIGEGKIIMKGMINMLDNMNRILNRVALYLA